MISNGRMTANGLQPYLLLLSIYQTWVYKKVNFLRFLLSGEEDVDVFVEATRKRWAAVRRMNSCHRALQNQPLMGASKPASEHSYIYNPLTLARVTFLRGDFSLSTDGFFSRF
jgi:hypothetical protein